MVETRHTSNLNQEIEALRKNGYRLDMIMPADSPREVQLSKNDKIVRLILSIDVQVELPNGHDQNGWIVGRAGMMYRDLLPDRLGGKLIASHIRLTQGGPVPDYVHYHKIDFQLIYCLRGRIRVVYEDQGEPFWIEPGDCVLQPPEIRHRVLECETGSEVLELTSPAEHETWVEHEMVLPTSEIKPDRFYSGQRFVRSLAKDANWRLSESDGFEKRHLGIYEATKGLIDVAIKRTDKPNAMTAFSPRPGKTALAFVVAGRAKQSADAQEILIPVERTPGTRRTEILRLEFGNSASHY